MSDLTANSTSQEEPRYTEEDLKVMKEFDDEMARIHDNPLFALQDKEDAEEVQPSCFNA